ncbi:MAG: hypothetical protein KDC24_02700 [Saprospiraceae bacterium]|nr:hypothetical protein [Saprospiraceae bacterium]
MDFKAYGWSILLLFCLLSGCKETEVNTATIDSIPARHSDEKIKGVSFVAPPRPFSEDPMMPLKAIGSNWVCVIPYAFTRMEVPELIYNHHGKQWWGEKPEGIRTTIELAQKNGLKVMLKPQVWIPRGWTGTLSFEDENWATWEKGYEDYILYFAAMAEEMQVKIFCLGTEFRTSIKQRPDFWNDLIRKVRKVYSGNITYAANWDDYEDVPFWDQLDFIGINSYFPLVDKKTANLVELETAWNKWLGEIQEFMVDKQAPLLFTEYGYLSVDNCTWQTWEIESNIHHYQVNETAQANAYLALYTAFWDKPYWAGGFLWKWFPEMKGHEGYPEKDYTPQGKEAEEVIRGWWKPDTGF